VAISQPSESIIERFQNVSYGCRKGFLKLAYKRLLEMGNIDQILLVFDLCSIVAVFLIQVPDGASWRQLIVNRLAKSQLNHTLTKCKLCSLHRGTMVFVEWLYFLIPQPR
jgi:hypothetical protein